MTERFNAFELVVAALGVAVTALLGYGQYRLGVEQGLAGARQREAETARAVDAIEVQVMTLVGPHLSNLAKPGPDFVPSERIVVAASEYLSNQHRRTALATMAARISEGNASASVEGITRLQEASVVAVQGSSWYAVVATLPPDNEAEAKRRANAWVQRVSTMPGQPEVRLYRTKISDNYAVVIGGPASQSDAAATARRVREAGLATDAFAQKDRDWALVGSAPFK